MQHRSTSISARSAMTLIEVTVVIAIIVMLLSLTLVGVQSIRESARGVECTNKLRQLSLTLTEVIHRTGKIPSRKYYVMDEIERRIVVGGLMSRLASELGFPSKARNGRLSISDDFDDEIFPPPVLICPSNSTYMSSYRINLGVDVWVGTDETLSQQLFTRLFEKPNRDSVVSDGFTNTAAFSERFGVDFESSKPWAITQVRTRVGASDLLQKCELSFAEGSYLNRRTMSGSMSWSAPHAPGTGYNHTFPPNSPNIDCEIFQISASSLANTSRISARSKHFGGVNVAFLDSSLRRVSNSIDQTVWQALGTHGDSDIAYLE